MTKEVFEDMQPGAAGGAKDKLEKQARQLAYDTKYKVKQAMSAKSGGKMDPAAVQKAYLAQLAKSPAPPAVKMLAKKKLIGEDVVNIKQMVTDSLVGAIVKEFTSKEEEVIEEEKSKGEQKFHIKVRDKKTGNTYHRYATRTKIAELRANPNIATVEMSHQGEAGTKAKKDYDGDGKVESGSKEHAGAVHNAIQRSKGGTPDGQDTRKEEVEISEAEESKIGGGNLKKLSKKAAKRIDVDVDGDVDHNDPKAGPMGEYVPSSDGKKRVYSGVKEEFSNWRDDLFEKKSEDDDEKTIDVMKGKNNIKVMPNLGEGAGQVRYCPKCDKDETREECSYGGEYWDENSKPAKGEDYRGMKAKVNMVRNKMRAMGLKMSHEPEGEMVEQAEEGPSAEEKQMLAKKRQMLQKTQMLQKQKLNLQKQGKLPIAAEEVEKVDEATYPSDFINPDGSKRSVAKKKTGRPVQHDQPMSGGRRKTVDESAEDSLRDRRMERGGVDGNTRYDRAPKAPNTKKFGSGKTMAQKEMEKKYGKGKSAMDIVRAQIQAKHGKGAIMDTKKKK